MYNYKNSPKEKVESIDLQVVIFGIQLADLSQLFIIYAVFYYVVNSIFAGVATVLAYFFFRLMEDRRSRQEPIELNRTFAKVCNKFRMIGDYFHSSAHVEFEEEVYRE